MVGTDTDWRIDAACSNQKHGLKRTNEDKRRCVGILFEALPSSSNRSIAEMAGVSHEFVGQLRPQTPPQVSTVDTSEPVRVTGKDGKQYQASSPKASETKGQTQSAAKPKVAKAAEVAAESEATPELVKLPDANEPPAERPSTGGDDTPDEAEPLGTFQNGGDRKSKGISVQRCTLKTQKETADEAGIGVRTVKSSESLREPPMTPRSWSPRYRAKKTADKTVTKSPKKPAAEKSTLAKARSAIASAAGVVADAVGDAAEAAQEHVLTPVAEAVGLVKKKPARKKAPARPVAMPTPLPVRDKTAAGKLMSKNLSAAPKAAPKGGHQAKSKSEP